MRTYPLWRTYGVPAIGVWTSFVSSCLFLVGIMYYAVSSVSVSTATRLAYVMYLDSTYADLTFTFV